MAVSNTSEKLIMSEKYYEFQLMNRGKHRDNKERVRQKVKLGDKKI